MIAYEMSKVKRIIDDVRQNNGTEIDLVDKGIVNLTEPPGLCKYSKNLALATLPSRRFRSAIAKGRYSQAPLLPRAVA